MTKLLSNCAGEKLLRNCLGDKLLRDCTCPDGCLNAYTLRFFLSGGVTADAYGECPALNLTHNDWYEFTVARATCDDQWHGSDGSGFVATMTNPERQLSIAGDLNWDQLFGITTCFLAGATVNPNEATACPPYTYSDITRTGSCDNPMCPGQTLNVNFTLSQISISEEEGI